MRLNAKTETRRFESLDALRGIAAIVVFFQHFFSMFPRPEDGLASLVYRVLSMSGSAAVDLFFVLSGFVLTLPYVADTPKRMGYLDFIVRRITRLYPAYWVAVAVALFARLALTDRLHSAALTDWTGTYWSVPLSLADVVRTASMVLPFNAGVLNSVFWSLLVEMQVSLILPLWIAVIATLRDAAVVTALVAATFLLGATLVTDTGFHFFPEFALGILLAKFHVSICAALARLSTFSALALLALSFALIQSRLYPRLPGVPAEYVSSLGSGLLIMLVLGRWRFSRLLLNRATVLFGTSSYSLYLLHIPILFALVPPLYALVGSITLCAAVVLVVAILSAQGVYKLVEVPCQEAGRRFAKRFAQRAPDPRAAEWQ